MSSSAGEHESVVIRDKRKIDREPGAAAGADSGSASARPGAEQKEAEAEQLAAQAEAQVPKAEALLLEERTADLQRLQAEYANYRRRVERDRVVSREVGAGEVLSSLLPILDDLDRAREHGDLTGGLKAVADKLDAALAKHGLQRFGEVGDRFDPTIHEAVTHEVSDTVDEPTCTAVMRPGYKHGDRLLRPAMVGVTDPATPAAPPDDGSLAE